MAQLFLIQNQNTEETFEQVDEFSLATNPAAVKIEISANGEEDLFWDEEDFNEDYNQTSATRLLSQIISENNKEFSDILNTVDKNRKSSATMLCSQAISDRYKNTSEVIKSVGVKKQVRKKSMKELMRESVFHGRSWMGENFIA